MQTPTKTTRISSKSPTRNTKKNAKMSTRSTTINTTINTTLNADMTMKNFFPIETHTTMSSVRGTHTLTSKIHKEHEKTRTKTHLELKLWQEHASHGCSIRKRQRMTGEDLFERNRSPARCYTSSSSSSTTTRMSLSRTNLAGGSVQHAREEDAASSQVRSRRIDSVEFLLYKGVRKTEGGKNEMNST